MDKHIQRLKDILSPAKDKITNMAIFGSYLDNPECANDVDVLIWVEENNYCSVKKLIKNNNSSKVFIEKYQCRYSQFPDEDIIEDDKTDNTPPVHIISLPSTPTDYQKTSLWIQNKDNLLFI